MPNTPAVWLPETIASQQPSSGETHSSLVQLADGNILVVWQTSVGSSLDVIGRIFDPLGNPLTGELDLAATAAQESRPEVVALADGGFLITYSAYDGGRRDVEIMQYDADGTEVIGGTVFLDPTSNAYPEGAASALAINSDGIALSVFGYLQSGAAGTTNGGYWNSNSPTPGNPHYELLGIANNMMTYADVAALTNGNFVVVSDVLFTAGNNFDSYPMYTIVDDAGGVVVSETYAAQDAGTGWATSNWLNVDALAGGGFVITWTRYDLSEYDIHFRVFDSNGVAVTASTPIASAEGASSNGYRPHVLGLSDGGFLIFYVDGAAGLLMLERFDATGSALGDPSVIGPAEMTTEVEATQLDDGRVALSYTTQGDEIAMQILDFRDTQTGLVDGGTWIGTTGNDSVTMSEGTGTAHGWQGDDEIVTGGGPREYFGDDGNDTIRVTDGIDNDSFHGGDGIDLIDWSAIPDLIPTVFDLEAGTATTAYGEEVMTGFEQIIGTSWSDTIYGHSSEADTLEGGAGDDELRGYGGGNLLSGGAGNDTLFGGAGDDTLIGGTGSDWLSGGAGNDEFRFGTYTGALGSVSGGDGKDTLYLPDRMQEKVLYYQDAVFWVSLSSSIMDIFVISNSSLNKNYWSISSIEVVVGSLEKDYLNGDGTNNTFLGRGGHDLITGMAGNDTLNGGDGDDTIHAGTGHDVVAGAAGADDMYGEDGWDTASYASSSAAVDVTLESGDNHGGDAEGDQLIGFERVVGSSFNDVLDANALDRSTLEGGAGNDRLVGGGNTQTLRGQAGNDTITAYAGSNSGSTSVGDLLDGGDGNDVLAGAAGADVIIGGAGADLVAGNAGADSLEGGNGKDTVSYAGSNTAVIVSLNSDSNIGGHAAGDSLFGFERLVGSLFGDTLYANGITGATIEGGGGNDRISGGGNTQALRGGDGNDTITGYVGNNPDSTGAADLIDGGDGNDILAGAAGNDSISGGLGDDVIAGNAGADTLSGGSGRDTVSYSNSGAGVQVVLNSAANTGGHAAGDVLDGFERIVGSGFADTLDANGMNGATIEGGAGNDRISGGANLQFLRGGGGNDTITGYSGSDPDSTGVRDVISGDAGNDVLAGARGDDTIDGGTDSDLIRGNGGDDLISGGTGFDTFIFGAGSDSDTILDFQDDIDTLRLEQAIWGGGLTAQQVVNAFADDSSGDTVFDFGNGLVVVLEGVTDRHTMADDIAFA